MPGAKRALTALALGLGVASPALFAGEPAVAAPGQDTDVEVLCPTFVIKRSLSPGLSDTEKRLICGDPQTDAWKTIPDNQARFALRNFLQDRGYFNPTFERDGGVTWVDLGHRARATALDAHGAPPELHLERKRKVIGEMLTPALLSAVEGWAGGQLEAAGYPCPKVKGEADPATGEIRLEVMPGPRQDLVSIIEESVPGLWKGMLRRYDAFRLGKPYDSRWLTVTANRITSDNLLENTNFTAQCTPAGAVAHQEVVPGPPRLLTAGFGIDTEGLVRIKLSWQNSRLGPQGSRFVIAGNGTTKTQQLSLTGDWYYRDDPVRQLFLPSIQVLHDNEEPYEYVSDTTRFAHVWKWDSQELGAELSLGPALSFYRVLRGVGSPDSHFLALEGRLMLTNHEYEFYHADPVQGFTTGLTVDANSQYVFSSASAQRLNWFGQALYNLKQLDPALLILGLRAGAKTTVTGQPLAATTLPPDFLGYLGGSKDLRGFGLQELTIGGVGGLSSFFVDTEVRLSHTLALGPVGLDPIAFFDLGALGAQPWSLDAPWFYSPGVGLRAMSPIGVFRTTLARGYGGGVVPDHLQFYLSYGEEF